MTNPHATRPLSLFILITTHVADATLTAIGLREGILIEMNPLLALTWDAHPINFFITKFFLVFSCLFVVFNYWSDRRMRYAIYAINVFMLALVTYELIGIFS